MTADLHARLKAHCQARGIPVAAFVGAVLIDALDDEKAAYVTVPTGYPKVNREKADALARELAARGAAAFTF